MTGSVEGTSRSPTRAALAGLARLALAEEDTQSVMQRVVDGVKDEMPAGAEVSMTLLRHEQPTTAAFTGELALTLDEMQYDRGHGPCLEAALSGQVVEIIDGRVEDRWPEYMPTFLQAGALSSLAVPIPAAQLAAALNVYAPVADAFTAENRQAVGEFAAYAGAALVNMDALQDALDLAENLQKAMQFRSVIEQAKGILIERHKLTADEAFRLLADTSMRVNRKVRDVAEELVLTGVLSH